MAGKGRNDDLPPDYVTLVQLRDIWMKKEEERKRKEKEEEERKLAEEKRKQEAEELRKQEEEKRKREEELRKQEEEKRNGGRWRGRVRRAGLIDEKGKRKEVIVGGYGNVEGDKKRSNDRGFRRPKSRVGERNRNEEERVREKFRVEQRVNNGKEVVPMNGMRGEIPDGKRVEFRGGFRKNGGNRGSNDGGDGLNQLKQNEGGSDLGGGVLDDKGYNQKRGEGGRNNGGYQSRNYRLKEESRDADLKGKGVEPEAVKKGEGEIVEVLGEGSGLRRRGRNGNKRRSGKYRGRYYKFRESRDAVLRGNGLELETEKKGDDGLLEVSNEKCSLSERDRNGEEKRKVTNEVKVDGEGLSDDRVALENKVGDGVIAVESVKNGKKEGVGEGFRGNGNGRGDSGKSRSGNRYDRYGNWKGRFVERRYNRFKESGDAVLIGNKLELETEKKAGEKILEVFNEKDTNNGERRNGINEDRAKGEGSSEDRVALESKVGDGFLMVERMKNGEKGGVGKGRGRFGKGKGKAKDRNGNKKRNRSNEDKVEGKGSSDDRVLMVESEKNGKKEGVGEEHRSFGKRRGKGEILEVLNEKDKNNDNERNRTNEDRAEGEGAVESMLGDGVLAMESVKNGEKEGVGVESRFENRKGKADDKFIKIFHLKFRISGDSDDDDERNKTNEDRAKAEGSSDDRMALESKVDDDGVLMVENVKNAEKEGVGKEGYGRHRNKEVNFGGRRSGKGYNGFGNGKGSFGEGRLGNRFNSRIANRRGNVSGMTWVKKEENSGPVAAGAPGVQHVKSN